MAGAGQQDVLQVVFGQVHRARCADQNAVLVEQAHGLLVQAAVSAFAIFQVFFAFDERRWVGHDHVETLFVGFKLLESFKHVAFHAGDFLGKAVQRSVALNTVKGEGRGVNAEHFAGAKRTGLNTPAADVAVQIQYAFTFDVRGQTRTVHAVVIEPAGFLPGDHRCFELHAVFFQGNPLRYQAEDGFNVAFKAFGITGSRVVLEQDAAWLDDLHQGCDHVFFVVFHCGRGQLNHQNVAETVNHQARQQIGVAVDQAVVRLVEQTLTQ